MVRDAGHEIGLHGYSHENPIDMSMEQQRDLEGQWRHGGRSAKKLPNSSSRMALNTTIP
jgi:peptidoglycan/xylan/chitin deacetylase (PgdA/CDA1 family)